MNCEKWRNWANDAAAGTLGENRQRMLDEHVRSCTTCREYLSHENSLIAAIDEAVLSRSAIEPSREFLQRVRTQMRDAEERTRRARGAWISAAACVAALILAAGIWTWRANNDSLIRHALQTSASHSSEPVRSASLNTAPKAMASDSDRERQKSAVAQEAHMRSGLRRRASSVLQENATSSGVLTARVRSSHRRETSEQPEIIVPHEQAEALMQFVRALNEGKVDGPKLLASIKADDQRLEIKPLSITPLAPGLEIPADPSKKNSR